MGAYLLREFPKAHTYVATHRSDANGARLLLTTVLFLFAFLSFLGTSQFFVICLVNGKVTIIF